MERWLLYHRLRVTRRHRRDDLLRGVRPRKRLYGPPDGAWFLCKLVHPWTYALFNLLAHMV